VEAKSSSGFCLQRKLDPVLVNGGQTLKAISLSFMVDVQDAWRRHGSKVLDQLAKKHPAQFFAGMVGMTRVVDWDTTADATGLDRAMTPEQIMMFSKNALVRKGAIWQA
jgi:hypothetical protein